MRPPPMSPLSVNPLPLAAARWGIYFRAEAEQSQSQTLATLADRDEPMLFRT
jgi:hypothetical protein